MNKIFLLGNISKDIELRTTPNGNQVVNFSMATNHQEKVGDGYESVATFHDLVAWGKNAENISKYFSKGSKILIEGTIRKREWTNKEGIKRIQTEVLVERFHFTERATQQDRPVEPVQPVQQVQQEPVEEIVETEISADDIPF